MFSAPLCEPYDFGLYGLVNTTMAKLKPGDRAPDFTLTTLAGQSVALSDYRGQPVLLVFLRHLG